MGSARFRAVSPHGAFCFQCFDRRTIDPSVSGITEPQRGLARRAGTAGSDPGFDSAAAGGQDRPESKGWSS